MVYGVNSGHLFDTIKAELLPFDVIAAADPDASGRALFLDYFKCPQVFDSAFSLQRYVDSSDHWHVSAYIIHTPGLIPRRGHSVFWATQRRIIL